MSAPNRTLLLVSHLVPYPPARGVEWRVYRLLKWLREEGYQVILVVPAVSIDADTLKELGKVTHAVYWTKAALRTRVGMRFPRLNKALWTPLKAVARAVRSKTKPSFATEGTLGFAAAGTSHLSRDDQIKRGLCSESLIKLVEKMARKHQPQVVIAEYVFLTPALAQLPVGTLKLVDTHDVFSRKQDQVLAYGIADPFSCTEEEEREYLLLADVIVAIQSREAELLKALVPEREVILAGVDFEVADASFAANGDPLSVAVIASDNALNVHGLQAFLIDCWPLIKAACPNVTLNVVGRVGDECRIEDSSVCYSGWVDDLDQVYRNAAIIINPTIAGTGLKIKSVQALAHGKPLVAWTNGVEGLNYDGEPPYRECRSWQEFGDAVVSLLRSEEERRALAERALDYARREFDADKVYAELRACLENPVSPSQRRKRWTPAVEGGVPAGG